MESVEIAYEGPSGSLHVIVQPTVEAGRYAFLIGDETPRSFTTPFQIALPGELMELMRFPIFEIGQQRFRDHLSLVARQGFGAGMLLAQSRRWLFLWRDPKVSFRSTEDGRLVAYHPDALRATLEHCEVIALPVSHRLHRSLQVERPTFSPSSFRGHLTSVALATFRAGFRYQRCLPREARLSSSPTSTAVA